MQRQGIIGPQRAQLRMRHAAGAHVILGVELEKAQIGPGGADGLEMLGLEADAGGVGTAGQGDLL
jgi:hypothetical protein